MPFRRSDMHQKTRIETNRRLIPGALKIDDDDSFQVDFKQRKKDASSWWCNCRDCYPRGRSHDRMERHRRRPNINRQDDRDFKAFDQNKF